MLCVEGALNLGDHVVIGVVRFHHADVIPSVEFFPSGCCSSCCSQTVSVIVNFTCSHIVTHFCIAKTGHLRCCLYSFLQALSEGALRSSGYLRNLQFYTIDKVLRLSFRFLYSFSLFVASEIARGFPLPSMLRCLHAQYSQKVMLFLRGYHRCLSTT